MLISNTNTSSKDFEQTGSVITDSRQVLGNQSLADDASSVQTSENPQPGETNDNETTAGNNLSRSSASSSTNSTPNNPLASAPPSTSTPARTGYNLNENWYVATAGGEGLYNTCWPAELNATNEAECIDESHPYSRYWFEGVGVSKSPAGAQEIAAAQVQQKADAQHVELRRGGGDDAVILTESLCATYGLDCGRW